MARSRIGRSALALTLVLAAALAAIGVLAWFVVRGKSQREVERAVNPRVELPADVHVDISAESTPLEARSVEKGDAGSAGAQAASTTQAGTGTLRLRVLDEKTRAPVPDLGYSAFRERGGHKELASGTTDEDGRAELREIEANTVIVRTERRPPYAEQTGAVWLTPGATKELELLLGPGGAFVGRVIDDLGQVVEGAEIRVQGRNPEQPETRSGADGRFRVECLASRPRSVWIVAGSMRPEVWEEVWVNATRDSVRTGSTGIPIPGKDVDLGDFVLNRASSYAGRLFDANDRLVDGALIGTLGTLGRRRLDPAFAGHEPGPGEVLTSGGGRFELANVPALTHIAVLTREGQFQAVEIPLAKPGERVEGVELRLRPETVLELELVDASGAPAEIPASLRGSAKVITPWRQFRYRGDESLIVYARSEDGARVREGVRRADPDGKWRARLAIDPRAVGEFQVLAAGYLPVVEHSDAGLPALVQRRFTLTPDPMFRVRLVRKELAKPLDGEGEYVAVQICTADPVRHARAGGSCCGLGAYWNERWRGEPLEIVLPVRRHAAFWIYAKGPRRGESSGAMQHLGYVGEVMPSGGLSDLAHMGPFEPGPEGRELVLDPADFVRPKPESRKPPEPSAPGERPFASLRAHVTDARTEKPISSAWVAVGGASATADENGDVKGEQLPVGTWKVRIVARGYQSLDLGERTTRERETLDLGVIALEPRLRRRGRILDADGAALPRAWLGIVPNGAPVDEENGGLMTAPDGSFDLIGELPASFVLQTSSPALHAGWGGQAQRFALEAWPEDVVKELRCARFRKVLVTVAGVDLEGAQLVPLACPAPGEPTATCDHRLAKVPPHGQLARGLEIASSAAGPRFAFLLPPGRFVLSGSNLMHELPLTEFEVTPGEGDIELTIQAR